MSAAGLLLLRIRIGFIPPKIRYPAGSQISHGIPDLVEIADHYLAGFAGSMQKLVISNINAYVCRIRTAGRKENEVANFQLVAVNFLALLVLLARGSGQINIELGKKVFYQP